MMRKLLFPHKTPAQSNTPEQSWFWLQPIIPVLPPTHTPQLSTSASPPHSPVQSKVPEAQLSQYSCEEVPLHTPAQSLR